MVYKNMNKYGILATSLTKALAWKAPFVRITTRALRPWKIL